MYDDNKAARQNARRLAMHHLYQYITVFISIILTALTGILQHEREPYHTSILTGKGWVMELLAGHPNHICCELGVTQEVFAELIHTL